MCYTTSLILMKAPAPKPAVAHPAGNADLLLSSAAAIAPSPAAGASGGAGTSISCQMINI